MAENKLVKRKRRPPLEDWLSTYAEPALCPEIPIVDAHHHLWDLDGWRYLLPEFLNDINCGHDIRATVYVSSRSMHRAKGPEAFRPVGETEFANGIAAMSASGGDGSTQVCAGIVGYADLRLGEAVNDVLDAHLIAGGNRFRGVRHTIAHDAEAALVRPGNPAEADLMNDENFRRGFAVLVKRDLVFEAWLYHPQIDQFAEFAARFPNTRIILNHLGGPLGCGRYEREEVFPIWANSMKRLAKCRNIWIKIGGLGMPINGFDLYNAEAPASSEELANIWRRYFDVAVEAFTPQHCLFESNFPVDKVSYSYGTFWNACKRLASDLSPSEKAALFWKTAADLYSLDVDCH